MAVYSYKYEDLGGDHYRRGLTLDEQHIYGSSRHAVSKPATLVYGQEIELTPGDFDGEGHLVGGYSVLSTTDNTSSPYQYTITRGLKYYEISNHLGNVMSTLRDYKIPQESSGDILNFTPDVSTWQDYLPFGMLMYYRNGDDGEVGRYGFQAQERDDELKGAGNSINFNYRMYDPRNGRFFAVDPLASQYPWNSPFAFSENRVIDGVELEGLERVNTKYVWANDGYKLKYRIDAGYGTGSLITWEGGPAVPEGYDERQLWNHGDGNFQDRVKKSSSRVWKEAIFVLKAENKSSIKLNTKSSVSIFSADIEAEQVFQKSTITLSKDGLDIDFSGVESTLKLKGGFTGGPQIYYKGSTSGDESAGLQWGPLTLEDSRKSDGQEKKSFLFSIPLTSSTAKGAGVTNSSTIKAGFEFEGSQNADYKEVVK